MSRTTRGALATALHTVVGFEQERIDTEIPRQSTDVLVIDLPSSGGPDLVRNLCNADASGSIYVMGVLGE